MGLLLQNPYNCTSESVGSRCKVGGEQLLERQEAFKHYQALKLSGIKTHRFC